MAETGIRGGDNIPYWLKGLLCSLLILGMIIFIGALSFLIGLPQIGMLTILPLLAIASILGGFIGELLNIILPINLKLVEGGGSPTLITQLLALIVYIALGTLIGWFYGKRKKK